MTGKSSIHSSVMVPRATIFVSEFETIEMATLGGNRRNNIIPRATIFVGELKTIEMTVISGIISSILIPMETEIVNKYKKFKITVFSSVSRNRNLTLFSKIRNERIFKNIGRNRRRRRAFKIGKENKQQRRMMIDNIGRRMGRSGGNVKDGIEIIDNFQIIETFDNVIENMRLMMILKDEMENIIIGIIKIIDTPIIQGME